MGAWVESNLVRKDFSILVDNKVNMIIFVAKAHCELNCVLAFFSLSVANRLKGVILSLDLAPVRAHSMVLCPVLYFLGILSGG